MIKHEFKVGQTVRLITEDPSFGAWYGEPNQPTVGELLTIKGFDEFEGLDCYFEGIPEYNQIVHMDDVEPLTTNDGELEL